MAGKPGKILIRMRNKDTKYLQFPLCLMQNLFTDKKGTMDKIFDAGIYYLSINPKFVSDQSQSGNHVLYQWYRHKSDLTDYLRRELKRYYSNGTLTPDPDYNGFVGYLGFQPCEIDDLNRIMNNDPEFHQAVIEFHQVHKAMNFTGITGNAGLMAIDGKAIVKNIPAGHQWPMINKDILFDFYKHDKDQWQLAQFAAYIAIGSIIGATGIGYKATNKQMILARMFGYSSHKAMPEILNPLVKELMDKYSIRYWMDKLLQQLELNWKIKIYNPKSMKSIIVGNEKTTIEAMALKAETGRRSAKIRALKDQKIEAHDKAIKQLNLQQLKQGNQ